MGGDRRRGWHRGSPRGSRSRWPWTVPEPREPLRGPRGFVVKYLLGSLSGVVRHHLSDLPKTELVVQCDRLAVVRADAQHHVAEEGAGADFQGAAHQRAANPLPAEALAHE